ncbi:MAG: Gfo/Idh/MocA family oxidoreductase [Opitutae bacterium]|nr:Gfo/Idh/MocA family oxidoreductase [Opitutae bacterium]
MKHVRLGIIGLGVMGQSHARNILEGKIPRLRLAAVADSDPKRLAHYPGLPGFATDRELIASGLVDAVLIATPHYSHTDTGIAALRAGLHVLVEKPISVQRADCERLLAAHTDRRLVFAAMFNQRTDPLYRKLRELVHGGALGEIRRVQWTVTNWFRPHCYYGLSAWRATWAGEGGGVLLNQCPHNLDLFSWIFGQPQRVRGFCSFGKYHDIEVEDDVTAYFELPGGATATFIASTGEAPGTNRLEVMAENGRVVAEGGTLRFTRNRVPTGKFSRTTKLPFSAPPTTERVFTFKDAGGQHVAIMRNFADAIVRGAPLVAPAAEGIRSVELANAILLSSWTDKAVELPLDGALYARWLKRKIAFSPRSRSTAAR